MKVLQVNINEMSGGASRAAHRLHTGLVAAGVESRMVVLRKATKDPRVTLLPMTRVQQAIRRRTVRFERPSFKRYPEYQGTPWSVGWLSTPIPKYVARVQPEVVHLHWLGDGFLSVEGVSQINKPLVWTLHDMWALTGGCHYSGACNRYEQMCGACPQLGSSQVNDLSRWTWKQKRRYWIDLNLTLVAPSRWMAACVESSWLMGGFRVEVIPNGIDTQVYRPFDKGFSRDVLNLPRDKKLVLFGAYRVDDTRKGFQYLREALRAFSPDEVELVLFGESHGIPDVGFKVHDVGTVQDDRILALVYSAADVFVAPSLQDNLPNTVMESMACGTPVVAFDIGGMPDMITHLKSGYLAKPFLAEDFAQGMRWVLGESGAYAAISAQARHDTETRFSLDHIATRYAALYEDVRRMEGKTVNR